MNSRFFILVATLCGYLLAPLAHAQYEIRGGATNLLDSRRAGGSASVTSGAVSGITWHIGAVEIDAPSASRRSNDLGQAAPSHGHAGLGFGSSLHDDPGQFFCRIDRIVGGDQVDYRSCGHSVEGETQGRRCRAQVRARL